MNENNFQTIDRRTVAEIVQGNYISGYNRGLKDAWEAARTIFFCNQGELCNIFPEDDYDNDDMGWLRKYSASEAIEKIEAWKKNYDIKIGDIVVCKFDQVEVLVTYYDGMWVQGVALGRGTVYSNLHVDQCVKTGRHVSGISELVKGELNQ